MHDVSIFRVSLVAVVQSGSFGTIVMSESVCDIKKFEEIEVSPVLAMKIMFFLTKVALSDERLDISEMKSLDIIRKKIKPNLDNSLFIVSDKEHQK